MSLTTISLVELIVRNDLRVKSSETFEGEREEEKKMKFLNIIKVSEVELFNID